jgi:hypothetical protein
MVARIVSFLSGGLPHRLCQHATAGYRSRLEPLGAFDATVVPVLLNAVRNAVSLPSADAPEPVYQDCLVRIAKLLLHRDSFLQVRGKPHLPSIVLWVERTHMVPDVCLSRYANREREWHDVTLPIALDCSDPRLITHGKGKAVECLNRAVHARAPLDPAAEQHFAFGASRTCLS